jgi:hypothetical protein
MQIILNVPDDLPIAVVQQYISTIETQMSLMTKLITIPIKTPSLKRGSAKKMITFIADDFCEPLDDFKDYM